MTEPVKDFSSRLSKAPSTKTQTLELAKIIIDKKFQKRAATSQVVLQKLFKEKAFLSISFR